MSGDKFYEISEIVGHREGQKGIEYLVHWKSYSSSADTWEPSENLKHCYTYIDEYMDKNKKKSVRRSTRLHPSADYINTDLQADTDMPTPKTRTSKIHAKKSTKSAIKTAAVDKPQRSVLFALNEPKQPPPTYRLRSTPVPNRNVDLTSDKIMEVSPVLTGNTMKMRTRMSATPQMKPITQLDFNNLLVRSEQTSITLREVNATMSELQEEDITVAQEDSESDDEQPGDDEQPAPAEDFSWNMIGWKEVVLVSVVVGIGAVGYFCHYTNYCSLC